MPEPSVTREDVAALRQTAEVAVAIREKIRADHPDFYENESPSAITPEKVLGLLDRLATLERERDALSRYLQHYDWCQISIVVGREHPCTCGLAVALGSRSLNENSALTTADPTGGAA